MSSYSVSWYTSWEGAYYMHWVWIVRVRGRLAPCGSEPVLILDTTTGRVPIPLLDQYHQLSVLAPLVRLFHTFGIRVGQLLIYPVQVLRW